MTTRRASSAWSAALAPVLVGTLVAIGLALWGPRVRVVFSVSPAGMALFVAVIATLVTGTVLRIRRSRETARAHARAETVSQLRADHHRFLDRLDHELKNPVMAIRAALAAHGDPGATHLAAADSQAARLADLVSDLRKLAELRTYPLQFEPVDLAELTTDAVQAVQEQVSSGGGDRRVVDLTFPTAPWQIPPISADPDLLYLAIHNLLSNAAKFTRPDDRIEVRATEDAGWVELEIADTGVGIPEEESGAVWEELARASNARATPGSGLGLSLVRVVVERHGGTVALRSRPGQGTSVRVRLPIGRD